MSDYLRFTDPQRRAIMWLPADGSWTIESPGRIAPGINSLALFHKDLAQEEWGEFGPRGGRCFRYRLTDAGVTVRKMLEIGSSKEATP